MNRQVFHLTAAFAHEECEKGFSLILNAKWHFYRSECNYATATMHLFCSIGLGNTNTASVCSWAYQHERASFVTDHTLIRLTGRQVSIGEQALLRITLLRLLDRQG